LSFFTATKVDLLGRKATYNGTTNMKFNYTYHFGLATMLQQSNQLPCREWVSLLCI